MPVIPMIGISKGKPCAILVTVSEKRYTEYMAYKIEVENPIPAKAFRDFLSKNKFPFEEVEQSVIAISNNPPLIYIWKFADFLDVSDIKNALENVGGSYNEFIDYYANHLKTL